jgi:hypothetical protein
MADTLVIGRARAPGVIGTAKLTTELSSLQTNTTLAASTPATKIVGAMVYPGVGGVQRLSTFVLASAEQTIIRSGPVNSQRWTMG